MITENSNVTTIEIGREQTERNDYLLIFKVVTASTERRA